MKAVYVGLGALALMGAGGYAWVRLRAPIEPTPRAAETAEAGSDAAPSQATPPPASDPPAPASVSQNSTASPPIDPPPEGRPGVDFAPGMAPTAYWAEVRAVGSHLRRKPSPIADPYLPLVGGAQVEVLAGESVPIGEGSEPPDAMLPARHSGQFGWVQQSHLSRLEGGADATQALWDRLVAAAGGAPPIDCAAAVARAELHARPGRERIVYSASSGACRELLGVFADGDAAEAHLLGYARGNFIHHVQTKAYSGRPDLLLTDEQWARSPTDTGTSLRVLSVPADPGPLEVVFEATVSRIQARDGAGSYEISKLEFPDPSGNGQWLIQQQTTERRVIDGKEVDNASEAVFAYDGRRFVPAPRPADLSPLPPLPSFIRHGRPEDAELPEAPGYP